MEFEQLKKLLRKVNSSKPILIALRHETRALPDNPESVALAMGLLWHKRKTGRRLFMEFDKNWFEDTMKRPFSPESSWPAIAWNAKNNLGYNVASLRELWRVSSIHESNNYVSVGNPELANLQRATRRYALLDLRERMWAQQLRKENVGKGDYVITHPNHTQGLAERLQLPKRNIIWIDSPVIDNIEPRNTVEEQNNLNSAREQARSQRRIK